MYNQRHKRIKKILVGQSLVAVMIIAIATFLISYAMGYRINLKNYTIHKIGILSLNFTDHPDGITIDGKEYKNGNNFYIGISPGNYHVVAKKDDCYDWHSNRLIKSGLVNKQGKILFFEKDPETIQTFEQEIIDKLNLPNTSLINNDKYGLKHNSYEIWLGDNLVTRYSERISGVRWFPGNNYISFQLSDQIRVIDKYGFNDTLLVQLKNPSTTKFDFKGNGRELYYRDGSNYQIAKIR